MSSFVLRTAQVATPVELLEDAYIVVEGGRVAAVGRGPSPAGSGPVADLGDLLIAPGFVDVHVHGGGGAEVNCPTSEQVEAAVSVMARFHATHGTTSLVATTVSDEASALLAAVQGVASLALAHRRHGEDREEDRDGSAAPGLNRSSDGAAGAGLRALGDGWAEGSGAGPRARVLGSHLEGPWIAHSRAGAQYTGALRAPSVPELAQLVAAGHGTVRMVTVAPELTGALELIRAARAAGAVVSVGHTDADFETTVAAFDAGARHATHLFNAMAPIHHRQPGPVAAALADKRVYLEIIADGVHIHPSLISLVADLAPERLVLVTDAIGATGTAPGRHWLGPLEVVVSEGRAVLAGQEETVAGSVLTMDKALALAVHVAGVPLLTALQATSLHPADALGERAIGRLVPGALADMVVLDKDLALVATLIGGRPAHDPSALFAPVHR